MNIDQGVDLMLKSSDFNPYTGRLSKKDNVLAAIELAKLCKQFAEDGQMDEAMNHDVDYWQKVINELNLMK